MSKECEAIHLLARNLERHNFPFSEPRIPSSGIYLLFEKGEQGHDGDRIVRIGTHTGENQLRSRLKQHFLNENKDRSIFRKNVGRSLLKQSGDPYIELWDLDLTTRKAKDRYSELIDFEYQKLIESRVSQYIKKNVSFCVFEVNNKPKRLDVESKIISTISWCKKCRPSSNWLGRHSPKDKVVESGLWLVNELYKTPCDASDIEGLSELIKG